MFRIGEFARFTRVSVKMLRHYDEVGLLRPAHVDPVTGYRYYTTAQLPRLNRILLLRELGFGLREIATLADRDIDEVYEARERALIDTIAADSSRLRRLRVRRAALAAGTPADVVLRSVPAQLVATVHGVHFAQLERYVGDHRARGSGPPLTLIGYEVTAGVPVTWAIPEQDGVRLVTLPAVSSMACLVHQGGYAGLPVAWQALLGWLERTGNRPDFPLREVYLRFDAEVDLALRPDYLVDEEAQYLTELQVPIQPIPKAAPEPVS